MLKWIARGSPALVIAAGLVLAATPAWAATGSGKYYGTVNLTQTKLPGSKVCFKTVGTFSSSSGTGSFSDGTHSYSGSITVKFDYTIYQDSTGTYTDDTCTTPGTYAGSVTSASINGGTSSAGVSCSWSSGSFSRSGSTETVDFPAADGTCSVNNNTATDTHVSSTGTFSNCGPTPIPPPPQYCTDNFTFTASNT